MTNLPARRVALSLLTAAIVGAIVGCGPQAAAPEDEAAAQTRTITGTLNGDVENVPTEPQRVIALWRVGSQLLELGITPVGAMEDEYLQEELTAEEWELVKDVPSVGAFDDVDIEAIIELDPDLMLTMDVGLDLPYDQLNEIAPVVAWGVEEPTDVWENYAAVSDAVGRGADYDADLAELDAALADINAEFGDALAETKAVALSAGEPGLFWADTDESLMYERMTAAGFGYLDFLKGLNERYVKEFSTENLPDFNEASLVFFDANVDGTPAPGTDALLETESFKNLAAVKAGNLFPLRAQYNYTFAATKLQLEDFRAAASALASQ